MTSINLSDLSILLIEPSAMQRKVILTHLVEEGVSKNDGVGTGQAALALLKNYEPDLIISSMYLPDMTATELLGTIRATESLKEINFMLVSSETSFKALDPIRQAGVVAILPKPFNHADLRRALRTTVDYIDPEEMELENYDITELKVLLVDDSVTARNHIKRVLNSLGIQNIQTASNGVEAVEILSRAEFDLIVTDLNMPEMDGQQLTEFVRNDMGNTYVPILMVTSEHDQARLGHVQQAGVSAVCDKPFEPQSIREVLYRVLDERS
ncbi:MAG: two-component system chemotaxis response regulator CheY [Methylophagaceae bacterium]|jgi:two-component system chemotaxis response regulator CheY